MVSLAQRREGVAWVQQAYQLSERRAVGRSGRWGSPGSPLRYRSQKMPREQLRARNRGIAAARVSYGYRQVHTLLWRKGGQCNTSSSTGSIGKKG